MSRALRGAKIRGISGAADQVFSSLSNGLILYAIAVVSSAQYFGRISLLLTLLAAAVGCLRGALGTPLLLKGGHDKAEIRTEGSYAITAALAMSPVLAGVMWLLEGGELGAPAFIIAVATPVVLVQDVLRYVVITEGRPHIAAIWDGLWFLGSVALLLSTWVGWHFADVNILIGGWAILASTALLGLAITMRIRPLFRGFFQWLATDWQHRFRYGIDAGLEQGALFLVLVLVTNLVSPVATAALRGATALLAPLAILTSALPLIVIPESARRSTTPEQVWRGLSRVTIIASAFTLIAGLVFRVLPDSIGSLLLGNSFGLTQHIVLITSLEYAIGLWLIALIVYLKTFNRSSAVLTVKVAYAIVMTGLTVGASLLFHSATGVAVGLAIASTLTTTACLAWFAPWRTRATPAEESGVVGSATVGGRSARAPLAEHRIVAASRVAPRPLPDYVRLGAHQSDKFGSSSALVALWSFAVLAIFGPLLIILLTGPPPNFSWLGPLIITIIAAARFSWILGVGERRLFEMMFWSFTYAFMGLAPITQIREREWPATVSRTDSTQVWPATIIMLIGLVAFLLGIFTNRSTQLRSEHTRAALVDGGQPNTFTVRNSRIVILAIFAIGMNMYYLSQSGWLQFLASRQERAIASQTIWIPPFAIFVSAGSYMSLLVCLVALIRFRREANRAASHGWPQSQDTMRLNSVLLVIIGLLLANSLNPINTARYLFGTAALAVAAALGLFATPRRFRIGAFGFLAGLLVVFPAMDAFRYSTSAQAKASNPISAFLSPDYDSWAQVMNGAMVASREGLHLGRQFLGVLLFWIPRAIWPEKPVDTGIYLAQSRGYSVTNLSAPLWIEIFLNGGMILLVLCMFALGYYLHAADTNIDRQLSLFHMPSVISCILPFYLVILLRGSLLQAMPYLFVTLACWVFVKSPSPRTRLIGRKLRRKPVTPGSAIPERQPAHA